MAGVGPDQLGQPTPCTEWDVRDVVAHTIGVVVNMGRGARGDDLLPDVNGVAGRRHDPATQFRTEADRTLGRVEEPGPRWRGRHRGRPYAGRCGAQRQPGQHDHAFLGHRPCHRSGSVPSRHAGRHGARREPRVRHRRPAHVSRVSAFPLRCRPMPNRRINARRSWVATPDHRTIGRPDFGYGSGPGHQIRNKNWATRFRLQIWLRGDRFRYQNGGPPAAVSGLGRAAADGIGELLRRLDHRVVARPRRG